MYLAMCEDQKEDIGLLTPVFKNSESGFRYYTADNMTQIRSIRSPQSLGLSLKLRADLDRNIQMFQVRSARRGDLTVHATSLPRQVCLCRRYSYKDTAEAASCLRDTYIAAARTGKMSMTGRMFTVRMNENPDTLDLICCILMEDDFDGPERAEFAETPALCVYYRGPYEGTGTAIRALAEYVREHNVQTTGLFRSIYLEGPPSRGEHSEDYITQVAVPVASLPENE